MTYTFRDTDIASRRLRLLAETYSPSSWEFLDAWSDPRPDLAVDLGCGPGHTTHLVAEATNARQVVGMDNSERFIEQARQTQTEQIAFTVHDITSDPFPIGPADLMYCRFLLTHLDDPEGAVSNWASQLSVGGVLLMEEVEWIETNDAVLGDYLGILSTMLESRDQQLYVGSILDGLRFDQALTRLSNNVRRLPVPGRRAAEMFVMNIASWREDEFVASNYDAGVIDRMADALGRMADGTDPSDEIEWGLRQIVLQRT